MVSWEAWCYRCRERDSGTEPDETTASGKVSDFRHDHQGSCGMGVSIGHSIRYADPQPRLTLTGDASREAVVDPDSPDPYMWGSGT